MVLYHLGKTGSVHLDKPRRPHTLKAANAARSNSQPQDKKEQRTLRINRLGNWTSTTSLSDSIWRVCNSVGFAFVHNNIGKQRPVRRGANARPQNKQRPHLTGFPTRNLGTGGAESSLGGSRGIDPPQTAWREGERPTCACTSDCPPAQTMAGANLVAYPNQWSPRNRHRRQ